jgi:hypothetical protein
MKILGVLFLLIPSTAFCADSSSLDLFSNDGGTKALVQFSVSDPAGRRTGLLPGGSLAREIPGSSYGLERIDPEEGPDFGEEGAQFYLRPVMAGVYTVRVLAEAATSYELTVLARNQSFRDISPATMTLRGTLQPGASQELKLKIEPTSDDRIIYQAAINADVLATESAGACSAVTLTGNAQIDGFVKVNGALVLSGNAKIVGDATAFPVTLSGNASISGTIARSSGTFNCFPIDLAFTRQVLDANNDNASIPTGLLNGGTLRLSGNSALNLPAGNYIVDRLGLSGNSKLRASGAVNIFVRHSVSLSGNSETGAVGAPINILVDSSADQTVSGKSVYSVFYAPRAKVVLNGATLFSGRLHADKIDMTGTVRVEAP